MTSYWIVVPRGNSELYDLLSIAFRGRSGFTVIVDRRVIDRSSHRASDPERRAARAELGPDEFIVAEQAVRSDRTSTASHRPGRRIPVIRSTRGPLRRRNGNPARDGYAAH